MSFDSPVLLAQILERVQEASVRMRMTCGIHRLANAGDGTDRRRRGR